MRCDEHRACVRASSKCGLVPWNGRLVGIGMVPLKGKIVEAFNELEGGELLTMVHAITPVNIVPFGTFQPICFLPHTPKIVLQAH